MKSIKITILLILFCQVLFGQNGCEVFKNYEESQKWIKEIKQLNLEVRKNKILDRIKCERELKKNKIDFLLTIIIDGIIISNKNDITNEQIENLNLIPADKFIITESICESDSVYPERCNLGFVVINLPDKPIINELSEFKNIKIKRRKEKFIIKMNSKIECEVEFSINHLLKEENTTLFKKVKLKIGKNRIVFKSTTNLEIVKLEIKEKKLIVII